MRREVGERLRSRTSVDFVCPELTKADWRAGSTQSRYGAGAAV